MSTPSSSLDSLGLLDRMLQSGDAAGCKAAGSRQASRPRIATSVPPASTATSTPSRTSFSTSSPSMGCCQSTPASPISLAPLPEPLEADALAPLSLPPRSNMISSPTSPTYGTAAADFAAVGKGPGLMRRISRGASNRLRRRTSTSQLRSRDQSSGPMRRRSGSRGIFDGSYDVSDLDLDGVEESDSDALALVSPVDAPPRVAPRPPARNLSRRSSDRNPAGLASSGPAEGTTFLKVGNKKTKAVRLSLDERSAKVFWGPPNSKKHVYVDDIKDIREGEKARNLVEEYEMPQETLGRWITILYFDPDRSKGRSTKAMHLVAPDERARHLWSMTLHKMMKARAHLMAGLAGNNQQSWTDHWHRAMLNKFGTEEHLEDDRRMDLATITASCRSFSINKSERALRRHFEQPDKQRRGALDYSQYMEFFRRLTERQDVRRVFEAAKQPLDVGLTFQQFLAFLHDQQGVDVAANAESWHALYTKLSSKYGNPEVGRLEPGPPPMSFEAFRDFILSGENSALEKPSSQKARHDRPLNEYFISSSHNTYLMGRQVHGESSTEGYIDALMKGCRCIEIDCWDYEGKPYVTHGRTLTSKVSFLDCIKVINKYAFAKSDYPLIVSLEVHCSPGPQRTMAEIMTEHFGDQLLQHPISSEAVLPSPEELRRKILIKVKIPRVEAAQQPQAPDLLAPPVQHRRQRSASAPVLPGSSELHGHSINLIRPRSPPSIEAAARLASYLPTPRPRGSLTSGTGSGTGSDSEESESEGANRAYKKKKPKTSNIVQELGALGVYTRGIPFSDWRSQESRMFNHIYSFRETTFEQRCKTPEMKSLLEKHNVHHLMRVYPRGGRINSSNFDPLQFWRRGVQMAATNWQTHDLGTQINDAMFAAGSDSTGYVLKPEELRRYRDEGYGDCGRAVSKKVVKFSVCIISAQYLEAPSDLRADAEMNPYVEFEMYSAEDKARGIATGEGGMDASARNGMSGIGSPLRKRTRIVDGNGYDPHFDETIMMTLQTKYPSLVFVRCTVWHSPDARSVSTNKEPLASFTAKLSSLQQGYRHLPLYDKTGQALISKLFVRINKEGHRELVEPEAARERASEPKQPEEPATRTGKDFLRKMFARVPSERKKQTKEADSASFSSFTSTDR